MLLHLVILADCGTTPVLFLLSVYVAAAAAAAAEITSRCGRRWPRLHPLHSIPVRRPVRACGVGLSDAEVCVCLCADAST